MRSWRSNLVALSLIALGGVAMSGLRVHLNARLSATKTQYDVFALPPPGQVVAMSLGYRSALADLIFAHVLVSAGIHVQEKRQFEFVGNYLRTVNDLDPKFEAPYRLTDALVTLQAKQVEPEKFREARRILERGLAELPFDQALWASAGQFFAYLGPSVFSDPKEQADWQLAGGRTLAHACELVGSNENIPYQCVVAAGLLTKAGADAASLQFLERMKLVNDDPQILAFVDALLTKAKGAEKDDRGELHQRAFQRAWGADLPFVTRGALLVVGPNWEPAACAASTAKCATSWRTWSEAHERTLGATSTPMTAD